MMKNSKENISNRLSM